MIDTVMILGLLTGFSFGALMILISLGNKI